MSLRALICTLAVFILGASSAYAQISAKRVKTLPWEGKAIKLDTLVIKPASIEVFVGDSLLNPEQYRFSLSGSQIEFFSLTPGTMVTVNYVVFPAGLSSEMRKKDTGIIRKEGADRYVPYVVGGERKTSELPTQSGLTKSGSISRGIAFGNAQNLSVNSSLNLQMSGYVTERVQLLASVTDDNIPIQPQGNTQQLQDFDQVFIQLFDKENKVIAGDFVLRRPEGYFMNYFKRAQGAYYLHDESASEQKQNKLKIEASASISKGRFARNVIQGVEGNQGPYRLQGDDNESFIIVLAGTEAVYIDGKLLERGQDKDYVIDYNAAEIIFTPKQFITKDRRITVEFQYSEKRYARPMVQVGVVTKRKAATYYFNAYSESDAKNQPLQQDLSDEEKRILSAAGDDFLGATVSGYDSVGYSNNAVLYQLTDSLGVDTVWVYSTNPDSAVYRVSFTLVGQGNGDYVEDGFTANGRKFRWLAPQEVNGVMVKQGQYAPVVLLTAPKKRQMVNAGFRWSNKKEAVGSKSSVVDVWAEGALSNTDLNTFSKLNNQDNLGYAAKVGVTKVVRKNKNYRWKQGQFQHEQKWTGQYEYTSIFFNRIERFREVEFERNWNTLLINTANDQHWAGVDFSDQRSGFGKWWLGSENFTVGKNYAGYKAKLGTQIETEKGWHLFSTASALSTSGDVRSMFVRHKADFSKTWGNFKLGYRDEHELNRFYLGQNDSLSTTSYQFYDWEISAGTADTTQSRITAFYRNRRDYKPDTDRLTGVANADQYGFSLVKVLPNKDRLSVTVSNRRLRVVDSERFTQSPENTLLGRTEYSFGWWKNAIQGSMFYEVGSGLEQRREFIYLEVPAGQGSFIWNDYDNDGVKDLNEFEVAQFAYEANFIRSFIQTNDYIKTYDNTFSQSVMLTPSRYWKNPTARGLKFLNKFSNQLSYKIDRKTMREEGWDRLNPFLSSIEDTTLLSVNASFRQILFFQKTDPTFGMDHQFQTIRGKALLSNGFEARSDDYQQIALRWNFVSSFTAFMESKWGLRSVASDFLGGRNYAIRYVSIKPKITWQPGTMGRLSLLAEYTDKINNLAGETAIITKGGLEGTLNSSEKGIVQASFNYYLIKYSGGSGGSLAFEMLESLTAGSNYVWTASVQRTVAKNLQVNLTYNGRKPESLRVIHSGGVQVRAFF
ncbi:MAG: hypothetical protein ACOVOO_06510 [Flavobacteriales bacterium]